MLPTSDDDFLSEILESIRKRARPIKYQVNSFSCTKVVEKDNTVVREKLELRLDTKGVQGKVTLRVHLWQDGWLWVDVRLAKSRKLVKEWTHEGRFLRQLGGAALVRSIEATIAVVSSNQQFGVAELTDEWSRVVSRGPTKV